MAITGIFYSREQVFKKLNVWTKKRLYYEGISDGDFLKRRTWFNLTLISLLIVSGLTGLGYLLKLKFFCYYGLALMTELSITCLAYLFIRRNLDWLGLAGQTFIILSTFVVILYLGGIPYSGGLILNGITVILSAIALRNIKWIIWLTALFILSILALALLQPYLTVPPEWTMRYNILFFILNTVWMTLYCTFFVIQYLKNRTWLEEQEKLRLKELDEVKTKLYTNITHEFRTPLTAILGMTSQMKKDPANWSGKGVKIIRKNGHYLLDLVNQMLDLSKIEAGAMKVHAVQDDIILYLHALIEAFHAQAVRKNIDLQFRHHVKQLYMDIDPEKMRSIMSNLVSNAIKYTPAGGEVLIGVTTGDKDKNLLITVKDNGKGIPEDKLPYIFDRFYQVNDNSLHHSEGTGLGLSLVRELVKLLGGDIKIESRLNRGTQVSLSLPITREAPLRDAFADAKVTEESLSADYRSLETGEEEYQPSDNDLPVILIVEDNQDVTEYLTSLLKKDYHIETSGNGKQGVQKALLVVPDIIISDVMMPVMDGFEMMKILKKDFRTSHIPIILLTAKADTQSRLEGLETGADAYLAKPFNEEELLIRIKSLIETRKLLRKRYSSMQEPPPSGNTSVQIEDAFMEKLRSHIEKNMEDESFGIPKLCYALAMSRTQLYRKFKALSEKSLACYIRSLKLRKAKELLEKGRLNVTQVAFRVGFKDLSHFSSVFKQEYGINPSKITK